MSVACRLTLRPSPTLAAAIVAAHGAAGLAAGLLMPDLRGAALAAALLALGGATAWRRALLRGAAAVRILELDENALHLCLASGEAMAVRVAPRRYVGRWLVTLPLRGPLARTLLVSADMLAPDDFRRLRLWALWGRLPDVAARQLTG